MQVFVYQLPKTVSICSEQLQLDPLSGKLVLKDTGFRSIQRESIHKSPQL